MKGRSKPVDGVYVGNGSGERGCGDGVGPWAGGPWEVGLLGKRANRPWLGLVSG